MSLHPAIVLLSVALGSELGGIPGAFLAVPLAATVAVTFRYFNEQIDLRTGDITAADVQVLSPEGESAAIAGEQHGKVMAAEEIPHDAATRVKTIVSRLRHRG